MHRELHLSQRKRRGAIAMDDLRNRRYKASLPPPQMYLLDSVTFLLPRQTNLFSPTNRKHNKLTQNKIHHPPKATSTSYHNSLKRLTITRPSDLP